LVLVKEEEGLVGRGLFLLDEEEPAAMELIMAKCFRGVNNLFALLYLL
jgi:hypothetical protein